jgi:hypothetical protein
MIIQERAVRLISLGHISPLPVVSRTRAGTAAFVRLSWAGLIRGIAILALGLAAR